MTKALNACVSLPDGYALDPWYNQFLGQKRLVIHGDDMGGFVFVRPTRNWDDLAAKAPVMERWVRRAARRRGIPLTAGLTRVLVRPADLPSPDPLDHVGSLGVRIGLDRG